MVSAGVHATGDVDLDVADVVEVVEIVEALLDGFGDRDRLGVRQVAEIAAGAADHVGEQTDVRRRQSSLPQQRPQLVESGLLDVGQHQVLFVRRARFAEAEAVGEIGDQIELRVGDVARRDAGLLQRQHHRGIARPLVGPHVALRPRGEGLVVALFAQIAGVVAGQRAVVGIDEVRRDSRDLVLGQRRRAAAAMLPFVLDLFAKGVDAERIDEDLDPRLVHVVAPAKAVVDAEDGFAIGDDVAPWHEGRDLLADHRRATEAAAHQHAETDVAGGVTHQVETDVVALDDGAILVGTIDRDLELARQVGEFRMEGGPLAQDLGPRARIDTFVFRDAGERVGSEVADAVARGLDRMHLDFGQFLEDLRHVLEGRPVELDVLARAEVTVTLVVGTRDVRQSAQLSRIEQAVGRGNPQHRRLLLDVQAVLQAQRTVFVLAQFTCQIAGSLVAELRDALIHDPLVEGVVAIHVGNLSLS